MELRSNFKIETGHLMVAAYKKRAKAGWSGGKKNKETSNRSERMHEEREVQEQLEEYSNTGTKRAKSKSSEKEASRTISRLRWIYKFSNGDIESLNKSIEGNEWFYNIRQSYYQDYKKLVPVVQDILKNNTLPNKILKQAKEVLCLLGIET